EVQAILITADAMFNNNKKELVEVITSRKIPAMYQWKEQVNIGGLISYGPDIGEAYMTAGRNAGLMLQGVRPQDIPVVHPTQFSLNINHETEAKLGIKIDTNQLYQLLSAKRTGVHLDKR